MRPPVDAKSRGGSGRAGKVPKEVGVQGSLNGNLPVSREGGWRGGGGRNNLITPVKPHGSCEVFQ